MRLDKKVEAILFISCLALFAVIAFYRKSSLKRNFNLTSGYIYEFGSSRNQGASLFFKFRFFVNGTTYYGNGGACARENELHFQAWTTGKVVQAIYEKDHPGNCELLLTKEDYRE